MNKPKVIIIACPQCGAPFPKREGICEYCGSYIVMYKGPELERQPEILANSMHWSNSMNISTGHAIGVFRIMSNSDYGY